METAVRVLVCVLVIGLLWLAIRPRYLFLVRIRDGVPHVAKGKLTAANLKDISDLLQSAGVTHGWVAGKQRGSNVVLAFSPGIPQPCRQQLRNLWVNQQM